MRDADLDDWTAGKDARGPVAAIRADVADHAELVPDSRWDEGDGDRIHGLAPAPAEELGGARAEQASRFAQLGSALCSSRQLVDEVGDRLEH